VGSPGKIQVCWMVVALTSLSGPAQITVDQQNGPIVLVQGSGSGTFTLHNGGNLGPLQLKPGAVGDKTTLAVLSDATVDLQMADDPKQSFPTSIGKDQSLQIRAVVKDVKGASAVTISLFNGSEPLEALEATAADAPLNITISGDGAPASPLVLNPGKPGFVTLKNGDTEAYTLQWRFRYRTLEKCGTVALLGNGSTRLALEAGSDVYDWSDFIRPSLQTGHLELGLGTGEPCCYGKVSSECSNDQGSEGRPRDKNDPASAKTPVRKNNPPHATLPTRDIPVSLTMQRQTATKTTIYDYLYVIICLIIGGIISLLASAVLPNSLRKSAFRRQLQDLANRTTGVSLRVDSNLRVLLRLDRNVIREALKNTWLISPAAGASLDDIESQIDQLTKRLGIAERIDDLRGKLEASYGTSPPSIVEDVNAALQMAADAMHSYSLSRDDMDVADKSLDEASRALGTLDISADLAKEIASKFTELKTRLANFLPNYSDLKTAMPGVFGILREPFDDAKKITPRMVYSIDYCVAAINTALDFAVVRQEVPQEEQNLPLGPGAAGAQAAAPLRFVVPEPPNDVVNKARSHQDELMRLLSSMAWQALREARLLVQEMREDTYEVDVLEELKSNRARVAFETMKARPYLPINFYVHYLKWGRETRAAMQRLSFHWTFPGGLEEEGTRVCHYLTGKEKATGARPSVEGAARPPETKSASRYGFFGLYERSLLGFFRPQRRLPLPVEVTVNKRTSLPGEPVTPGPTLKGSIELEPEESRFDFARLTAEGLRFAIAFGVALAGLLSGGIEQIAKLDLIPATLAIIGLGFAADAVKNVLTQPSSATAAK
jgi:hypothetical protein